MTVIERWVEAWEHPRYRVSNWGEVFDIKFDRFASNRIFKRGRKFVTLYNDRGQTIMPVARLVAYSFFEVGEGNFVINHKDGDPSNDAVWNLEVVTEEQNREHAYSTGLMQRPHRILNLETGDIYESAHAAGRALGLISSVHVPKNVRESNSKEFRSRGIRLKLL